MNRRQFVLTAGGATAATGAVAGPGAAQENETGGGAAAPEPDFGGWFGDVPYFDGVTDARGSSEVTVTVGGEPNNALSFVPAAIHVDPGTTVVWEWSGDGGSHNVVDEGGDFESDLQAEAGSTFEYTFEDDGIYNYYCDPHRSAGMKGSVVVGTDYPAVATGSGPTPVDPTHMGVPFQAHFVGMVTILAILMSLLFTFFLLKYGESPNTMGGNN